MDLCSKADQMQCMFQLAIFFWLWLQLMVRDCSIAPKRDNLVDGDRVNWGYTYPR